MSNINITNDKKDDSLKSEIMKLKLENSNLRSKVIQARHLVIELNNANEHILKLNKEKYELMVKQNEEIKKYKLEMEKILNEKDFHQLNYDKRLTIFEQKMGKINDIEMENKVYKEELKELKEKNKILEEAANVKLRELEINNQIKFKNIKNKIMNNLTEAKNNMIKTNLKHMDLKTNLIYIQNNKLINDIDLQNKTTTRLLKEKNKLKKKLLDLENQKEINEKVQLELAYKLNNKKKEKGNNNSINTNLFNKKNQNKKLFKIKKNLLIINGNEKFLDSNIFKHKETDKNKKSIENILKTSKKKLKTLNDIDSYINTKLSKNIEYKKSSNTLSKEKHNSINNISNNESLIIDPLKLKYKQIAQKKENEIKNLNIKIDTLKNRIAFFIDKYKKLYNFLEECLDTFFWELKGENNYKINYDELSKFNFEKLNKNEKYAVLVLLMNHLLPIITFNFNSNCNLGNNIFSTNINIFDKNFNKTNKHLNDNILKRSFFGKDNKLQRDLFIKNDVLFDGTIPVLRKSESNILDNSKLKEDKYKFIL